MASPAVPVARPEPYRARRGPWWWLRETLRGYGFLGPALVILLLFQLGPIFYAAYLSLHDARIVADMWHPGRLVWFDNYAAVVNNADFRQALGNTVWYVLLTVPAAITLSLLAASLLNRGVSGRDFYRTAYFVPYVTSTVGAALVWDWVFQPRVGVANGVMSFLGLPIQRWVEEPRGVVQLVLGYFGIEVPSALVGPALALVCIAVIQIWHGIGFDTVIMLAGLTAIPKEQYEAAMLEGAGTWARLRYVTLPLLSPTLFFLLITSSIRAFQTFNWFYVIYNGVPPPEVKVVTIYLFENGFRAYRTGYASTVGFVLFGVILTLTLLQMYGLKRWVHYS